MTEGAGHETQLLLSAIQNLQGDVTGLRQDMRQDVAALHAKVDAIVTGAVTVPGVVVKDECAKCKTQWLPKSHVMIFGAALSVVFGLVSNLNDIKIWLIGP